MLAFEFSVNAGVSSTTTKRNVEALKSMDRCPWVLPRDFLLCSLLSTKIIYCRRLLLGSEFSDY